MKLRSYLFYIIFLFQSTVLFGQYNLLEDNEFEIANIDVRGNVGIDAQSVMLLSGLKKGQKIALPSEDFTMAIKNLWKQDYFSDIAIDIERIENQKVYLVIKVQERTRLSSLQITGVKKGKAKKLKEQIDAKPGSLFGEHLIFEATQKIERFYQDKGFFFVKSTPILQQDENSTALTMKIDRGERVKIDKIEVSGNTQFKAKKIRRYLKETKQKNWIRFYKTSKYIPEKFAEDKNTLINRYRKEGFRNARIISDSIVKINDKLIRIFLEVEEGEKFYYRNISFVGNTIYSSERLSADLGIKSGDLYNQELLRQRLDYDPKSARDITGLYMNNGYLMVNVQPVEVYVGRDSVDLEIRIFEGEQFRIGRVIIQGNDKTKDYVIQRELRTLPGNLFSREDVIRSQQELSARGYFNPETINIVPIPNQATNTVDIEYTVEETSSDQIELSIGYGGNNTFIASVGLVLKNFSIQDMFNKSAWRPLPSGSGQELALKVSTNGSRYQNYSLQFMEPWLGGKKPYSFNFQTSYSLNNNGLSGVERESFGVASVGVGFGQQLKFPDDHFSISEEVLYQFYDIYKGSSAENFSGDVSYINSYNTGYTHNISFTLKLQRRSINQMIYPSAGSHFMLSGQVTPPYSLFWSNQKIQEIKERDQYPFAEYYKIKFTAEWFTALTPNQKLVLRLKAGFGYLGYYNSKLGLSPFERFSLGGSGLSGIGSFYYGREIVPLRGYEDEEVSYVNGSAMLAKYILELRYPAVISPAATLYGLVFAEAGNTWMSGKKFNPFDLKKSIGVGIRVFLPIVGMLGLDYGWGIDRVDEFGKYHKPWQGTFNFILGFQLSDF